MARSDAARLPVYFLARDLDARSGRICAVIARARPDLADQLRRAAASVTLNIAEGAGEYRPLEKARFYRIARRSASECTGILDVILDHGLLTAGELRFERELARRIVAQLVRLCKRMEAAHPTNPRPPRIP